MVLEGSFPHEKVLFFEFILFMWSQPYKTFIAFSFEGNKI